MDKLKNKVAVITGRSSCIRKKSMIRHRKSSINFTVEDLHKNIFQQHPFQESITKKNFVDEIFNNNLIRFILDI